MIVIIPDVVAGVQGVRVPRREPPKVEPPHCGGAARGHRAVHVPAQHRPDEVQDGVPGRHHHTGYSRHQGRGGDISQIHTQNLNIIERNSDVDLQEKLFVRQIIFKIYNEHKIS